MHLCIFPLSLFICLNQVNDPLVTVDSRLCCQFPHVSVEISFLKDSEHAIDIETKILGARKQL